MGCTCRNGRRRALHNLRGWPVNSQRPAIVRAESHRATSKMHHFQPSDVYETGSRLGHSNLQDSPFVTVSVQARKSRLRIPSSTPFSESEHT